MTQAHEDLTALALRVEALSGTDEYVCREINRAIILALYPDAQVGPYVLGDEDWSVFHAEPLVKNKAELPKFCTSIDAAMGLLPKTACNHSLSSFIGHGNEAWGKFAWSFRFMDTAQLMGERAAKEEIARLNKQWARGDKIVGPPMIAWEKAIAQHYIEFYCAGAFNAALAIVAAALRAMATQGERG